MPEACAQQWFAEVFLGLEHIHVRVGALLRDLKHQNVAFSASGHVKLIDFGISHPDVYSSNEKWTFGHPPGSPGFCAPEVYLHRPCNYWCDFYSLGVILWLMRTGGVGGCGDPPTGKYGKHFKHYVADGKELMQCIESPKRHGVRSIEGTGQHSADIHALVKRLESFEPKERGSHSQIRAERMLQQIKLPEMTASHQEVEAWLSTRRIFDEVLRHV